MQSRMTILVYLLLIAVSVFGQDLADTAAPKSILLLSKSDIKPNKRLILAENDSFIIYSTFAMTTKNLKGFISEYDIEEDKELQAKLFNTAKSLEQNMQDIQSDPKLKGRLQFRTANLLEQGKCIVYKKIEKTYVRQVLHVKYIKNWWTGIRFSTIGNETIMDIRTGAF
jgi:hypothetical protein